MEKEIFNAETLRKNTEKALIVARENLKKEITDLIITETTEQSSLGYSYVDVDLTDIFRNLVSDISIKDKKDILLEIEKWLSLKGFKNIEYNVGTLFNNPNGNFIKISW